jgi:hypothetical protein
MLGVNPNVIVLDSKAPLPALLASRDVYLRRFPLEFERVVQQILEDLSELHGIGMHGWQPIGRDDRLGLGNRRRQISENALQHREAVSARFFINSHSAPVSLKA